MKKVCISYGDGIGPEIMQSVISILNAAKVNLSYEIVDIGEEVYLSGISTGISENAWLQIMKNKILLKGPMTTPLGNGYKSINVTLRKKLKLFANIRPIKSYEPYISSIAQNMNMVIFRENEEDLYSGIEYQSTHNSYLALKLISETGCYKIIRYAFEYAIANNRKHVTCITKNNIMKLSDGAFARIFHKIAQEYSQITHNHMIVDIGAARIASQPKQFDVVVTLNLYGDIISDIAAEAAGTIGIAGSANIGEKYAMFEAVHGSAPDIANQNKANPSGLLHAAIMMLKHLNMYDKAENIENAWLKTIKSKIFTFDICAKNSVSTTEFTQAIIDNLNTENTTNNTCNFQKNTVKKFNNQENNPLVYKIVGCDIFIRSATYNVLQYLFEHNLKFIAHKGLIMNQYDGELDMIQLRFIKDNFSQHDMLLIQQNIINNNLEIVMIHVLTEYDTIHGYSKMQGE